MAEETKSAGAAWLLENCGDSVVESGDWNGQDWVTVETNGRAVTLGGVAPSVERQRAALEAAAGIWGVASVRDRTELIPLIEPFAWAIERDGAFVILTGYVPSEEARQTVRSLVTAILPQAAIDDRTELAQQHHGHP